MAFYEELGAARVASKVYYRFSEESLERLAGVSKHLPEGRPK